MGGRICAIAAAAALAGCATTSAATTRSNAAATNAAATNVATSNGAATAPANTGPAHAPPPRDFKSAVQRADDAMLARDFDGADRALDAATELAGNDAHRRASADYERATLALFRGDAARAAALLAANITAAEQAGDVHGAFWAHNELTWVRWFAGDLAGAILETEAQRRSAEAAPADDRAGLMRHALWDRAYLVRALAAHQPADSRAPTLAYARDARAEYDRAAQAIGGEDGQAVLAAFFALEDGDAAAARQAASRVDAAKDGDLQDLDILWRALAAGGDRAGADAIRARIRASRNVYLALPIYQKLLDTR